MEEVLYLEPDEEITSVIDKMKQAKSKHLALVVPREATLLQSVVNLKLLMREAASSGKEIALVTADKIGRNLAAQVGLVVYDSIRERQPIFTPPAPTPKAEEVIEIDAREKIETEEPEPKGVQVHHFQKELRTFQKEPEAPQVKPKAWRPAKTVHEIDWSKTRKIIWPMLVVVIVLILIIAYLFLPKVNVKIRVKAENFQKSQDVTVSSNETTNLEKSVFGGSLIDLSGQKENKFTATGKKNLGGKAAGTLTLYNYWDSSPQSLANGAKFSASSKTFVAKSAVTIPGSSIRGGNIVPGTTTVDIEAEEPGEDYNIKAGRFTIVGLPSAQQEKIYGQASKDLTGGFSKEVTVVSQNDYDQAKDKLSKELTDELKGQLTTQAEGKEVLDKAIQIDTTDVSSSAKVDAEASDFTLKIQERLRVIVFDRDSFNQFVIQLLEKQIAYDKMISLGPNDAISPTAFDLKYDQQLLNLKLEVYAKMSSRIDTDKVQKDLLGKSGSAAEDYLNNLAGADGFEMKFAPSFWFKRIPNYNRDLEISLEYDIPETSASPSATPTVSPSTSPQTGGTP